MSSPTATAASLLPSAQAADNSLSFQGLNQLSAAAAADPHNLKVIQGAAQKFEALFMQQIFKAMNGASLGPDLMGVQSSPMYSMYTQQLATTISQGPGIGLSSFLAKELATRYGPNAHAGAASSGAAAASGTAASSGAAHAARIAAAHAQRYAAMHRAALTQAAASSGSAQPTAASGISDAQRYAALNALHQMPDAPGALKPWRHATGAAATSAANPVPAASTAPAAGNVAQHPAAASGAGGLSARAHAFVQSILPSVKAAAAALQVSPVAILAQAALETGWGSHAPGNNLFGVKAGSSWQGSSLKALTTEVSHGVAQAGDAVFRAYDSAAQSVGNYAQVLRGSRYDGVRGHGDDIAGFANALQRSGYATDPDYARKLLAVAQSPTMREALAGFSDSSLPPP